MSLSTFVHPNTHLTPTLPGMSTTCSTDDADCSLLGVDLAFDWMSRCWNVSPEKQKNMKEFTDHSILSAFNGLVLSCYLQA